MRRLAAASALVLTAFFAIAGAYHHHGLPRAAHGHTGLCSNASDVSSLDSCAICKATHAPAHRLAVVTVVPGLDQTSPLLVANAIAPLSLSPSLLHGSRAPPTV